MSICIFNSPSWTVCSRLELVVELVVIGNVVDDDDKLGDVVELPEFSREEGEEEVTAVELTVVVLVVKKIGGAEVVVVVGVREVDDLTVVVLEGDRDDGDDDDECDGD